MNKNDITGDTLISKKPSQAYDEGYDRIFRKHKGKLADKEKPPIKEADKDKTTAISSS